MLLVSCIQTETSDNSDLQNVALDSISPLDASLEPIFSLLGEPFPPKSFEGTEKQRRMQKLAAARENYDQYPDSLEFIVWYGRRLGYLGRYREAINIYNSGIQKYPESYHLLRHRGEAFITIRNFDQAISDLEKAAFFAHSVKNEIEEDGQPNRLNKPLKNISFSIWYHLGLSYYLKGNFDQAISAYKKCLEASNNDDLVVATTTWLYRTYIKIGNTEEAEAILEPINGDMRLVENRAYHNILMLFKNKLTPDRIYEIALRRDNSLDPTVGYGLGNWYVLQGMVETATETFDQVLAGNSWDSFGYIASEVERANLASAPL